MLTWPAERTSGLGYGAERLLNSNTQHDVEEKYINKAEQHEHENTSFKRKELAQNSGKILLTSSKVYKWLM